MEDVEYPPKRERARSQYFKILDCCNFFASLSDKKSISLLTSAVGENEFVPSNDIAQKLSKSSTDWWHSSRVA